MRERHTTINFDAFGQYRVIVVIAKNLSTAIEHWHPDGEVEGDIDDCKALTHHLEDVKESIIFLRSKFTIADIVHESWHVIFRMFEYFGAELEDEVVAYHLDYLVQQIYNFAKRRR